LFTTKKETREALLKSSHCLGAAEPRSRDAKQFQTNQTILTHHPGKLWLDRAVGNEHRYGVLNTKFAKKRKERDICFAAFASADPLPDLCTKMDRGS